MHPFVLWSIFQEVCSITYTGLSEIFGMIEIAGLHLVKVKPSRYHFKNGTVVHNAN